MLKINRDTFPKLQKHELSKGYKSEDSDQETDYLFGNLLSVKNLNNSHSGGNFYFN